MVTSVALSLEPRTPERNVNRPARTAVESGRLGATAAPRTVLPEVDAMSEISIEASDPIRSVTATARAGGSLEKNFAYSAFIVS
jgi:hypothetical protein